MHKVASPANWCRPPTTWLQSAATNGHRPSNDYTSGASSAPTTTRAATEAVRIACRIVAKLAAQSTIKQAESKSFTQFVDRLQATMDSSALPAEAKGPVVQECLCQQCSSATKEILCSLPARASLATMIKHVTKEEHLAPIQAALCTAIANVIACFKCGWLGHIAPNCLQADDLQFLVHSLPLCQN